MSLDVTVAALQRMDGMKCCCGMSVVTLWSLPGESCCCFLPGAALPACHSNGAGAIPVALAVLIYI